VDGSVTFTGSVGGRPPRSYVWNFAGGNPGSSDQQTVVVAYASQGAYQATLDGTDGNGGACSASVTVTVNGGGGGNQPPVLAPIGDKSVATGNDLTFTVTATDDGQPDGTLSLSASNLPAGATFTDNNDGTGDFQWLNAGPAGTTNTTFTVSDGQLQDAETIAITVSDLPPPPEFQSQTDFKIMMNYELGMHCTGFEFAYCCVLPVYNSILAQVVKPNTVDPSTNADYARLLEGDPNDGLDALGRETVVRDLELNGNGGFKKYVLKYWHEAQPRNDGRGKVQTSTLISAAEGNSLMAWNTTFDSAEVINGALQYGSYNGATGVLQGDGDLSDPSDNYQNAVWNHLYIYSGLEGDNPTGSTAEADKIRLGVNGQVVYPPDCGAALHPLGPVTQNGDPNGAETANTCGGFSNGNVLTFSGDKGTVVYTQMKVLENLPVMLTSPRIWEALGLPLTPFEDSIDFFSDPGLVDEDSVRPFVAMRAQMYEYDGAGNNTPVLASNGKPVIGFGTAPIDIPNCERCHSNPADGTIINNAPAEGGGTLIVDNSPNNDAAQYALVEQEKNYWDAYYSIDPAQGDSDWYSRLKSAAISMLSAHDAQHGTSFTANYPACGDDANPASSCGDFPQNTRLGHEAVICQRCHADNVIAVVKSANCGQGSHNPNDASSCEPGDLIKPITEAVHHNHRGESSGGPIAFTDSLGRDGGCQGCHPAHRSNGDMNGYPITLAGTNKYANSDNRGASGGCFVGRDVHSNPGKDTDGAETPEHLNAVGQWLADNVSNSPTENKGIWCTNCHNQLGQEMWKAENMSDLVHGVGLSNPRGEQTLDAVATAVGTTLDQAIAWLDPKEGSPLGDFTHAIWDGDPGLCQFLTNPSPAHDGTVATVEVAILAQGQTCSTGAFLGPVDCSGDGGPVFNICGTYDGDGDFSVNAMDFCTTPDCVAAAQATLTNSAAVAVPFSAATDGRDHWLAPGEPHCADCHAAPYVEQSGNINPYPPFNYPRKASLMRYSRGHQDITCQGCHESIHGLYPVTPNIDTTTYAQAAALNADGSHGPLKCGTCHQVDGNGIPSHIQDGLLYNGQPVLGSFDRAVSWMHTFTAEADPLDGYCLNCHEDRRSSISSTNKTWTEHSFKGRSSREMMDKAELLEVGHLSGDPAFEDPAATVCTTCHGNRTGTLARRGCSDKWRNHLIEGRASESVWEYVSTTYAGSTCGW